MHTGLWPVSSREVFSCSQLLKLETFAPESCPGTTSSWDVIHSLLLPRLSPQVIQLTTHTPFGRNQSLSIAAAPNLILYQRTTGGEMSQTGAVQMKQTDVPAVCYTIRAPKKKNNIKKGWPCDPAHNM